MKRVLFFAYTPFQVIASLAILDRYYLDSQADIILADSVQSRDMLKVNIEKHSLFHRVYYGDMRKFFPKSSNLIKHEWNRIKTAISPYYIAKEIELDGGSYDVFISTEVNYYTESIYTLLRSVNPKVKVELMDEGYSSYTFYFKEAYKPTTRKNRFKSAMFKIPGYLIGRKFMAQQASVIYYFAPELLCWSDIPYEIRPVSVIDDEEFLNRVNLLFSYKQLRNANIDKEFDRMCIYFEESFFWSVGNSNDVAIIDHIAEIIGKDNMAIKLHPRNEVNRFKERGYKTNETYGLPWEVIAANLDKNSHKIFVSFSSGAVLNYKFLCSKNFKTILLYKCIGDQYYEIDDSVKEWFGKFKDIYGDAVFIPETMQELDDCLRNLVEVGR